MNRVAISRANELLWAARGSTCDGHGTILERASNHEFQAGVYPAEIDRRIGPANARRAAEEKYQLEKWRNP